MYIIIDGIYPSYAVFALKIHMFLF